MFAIHRILSRSVGSTFRATTWHRCYCKPKPINKRFLDHEKPSRRGTYKTVRDSRTRTDSHTESTQQEHAEENTSKEQKDESKEEQKDESKEQSKSSSSSSGQTETDQRNLMVRGSFENIPHKNRDTFLTMVKLFETRDVHRRNHVEFIYAALKNMREYGVNRDLVIYKALIDVMPKGKFIPTNVFQAEFNHYPKQQQCIIDLLEQMEENGEFSSDSSACDVLLYRIYLQV